MSRRVILASLRSISSVLARPLAVSCHHLPSRTFRGIARPVNNPLITPPAPLCRAMSARPVDLSYEQVLQLKADNQIYLVDVRENAEIQETGKLPDSVHIPLGELPEALQSSPEQFRAKYGADPPEGKDAELVFSCRGGVRSRRAMTAAQELGYTNSRHYAGGWMDYEKNFKK